MCVYFLIIYKREREKKKVERSIKREREREKKMINLEKVFLVSRGKIYLKIMKTEKSKTLSF